MSSLQGNNRVDGMEAVRLAPRGLGMEMRANPKNYRELIGIPRSVYYQQPQSNTTETSCGMPAGSSEAIFSRLSSPSGLQVSSTSASDTSAGTGAITIYIDGLKYVDGEWFERSSFSTPTTLNGQTAVQIGTLTDWYRINKVWVLTAGSNGTNVGDLYISPLGQSLTAGVPDANVLAAVHAGFGNSTGGVFSVASNYRFN